MSLYMNWLKLFTKLIQIQQHTFFPAEESRRLHNKTRFPQLFCTKMYDNRNQEFI